MLVDMTSGAPIMRVPYAQEYTQFMSRMTPAEISAAKTRVDELIDGTEIQTAGWMPGNDWTDTPFQPVYEKAAR